MQGIPTTADVVVIGGGPAGSSAANLLAQKGYEVVLLEKARHPRLTVGESLIPHFWKYLDELGATEDIRQAGFIVKTGGTAIWRGRIRQLALKSFGYDRPPLHVERGEFDHILLRVAQRQGAQVFERVAARKVHLEGPYVRLSYEVLDGGGDGEIRCRYVIDASGQSAVLANQFGFREFDRDLRFMSIWGYFEDSDYVAQGGLICPWSMRREVPPTTVQAGIGEWGWCWHIAQKDSSSVGLVLAPSQQAEFKTLGKNLEQRLIEYCRRVPVVGDLLKDARFVPDSVYGIRDFAYRPTQLAGDRWYLAGDAAAFVDPINSAGVLTAFYTGSFAAMSVDSSLRNPARREYFATVFRELVRQRLTLFRLSALPEGVNSYPEDYPIAVRAAQLDSAREQELLLAQTKITDRPGNLAPLYALDNRLGFTESDKYKEVAQLTRIVAEAPENLDRGIDEPQLTV
jgi:flavin-dependent dehydrogenase